MIPQPQTPKLHAGYARSTNLDVVPRCMDRTYHRYDPAGLVKLVCLECEKAKSEVTK